MTPSINELTHYGLGLHKGDRFKLHDKGADLLNKRHETTTFKPGDVLIYPKYKNLDVPPYSGSQSVWMEKDEGGYQVDVDADLFSEKIK